MWRRGPTGKGTLCNACGVKWSLKFRKRVGKKGPKSDRIKEEPREQRQSQRKKNPVGIIRKMDISQPDGEPIQKKDEKQYVGLYCNHSAKRKRDPRDELQQSHHDDENKKPETSNEDDSFSDEGSPQESNRLLGRLLNVVEVQLVEEEELDRVKKKIKELKSELDGKERQRNKQFEQTKVYALYEVLNFRREFANLQTDHQDNLTQECVKVIQDFSCNMKNQIEDVRKSLSDNGIGKKLDQFQSEFAEMQAKLETNLASIRSKVATDTLHLDKLLGAKEENIRNEFASLKQESDLDFFDLHKRLDFMEDSLERGP